MLKMKAVVVAVVWVLSHVPLAVLAVVASVVVKVKKWKKMMMKAV